MELNRRKYKGRKVVVRYRIGMKISLDYAKIRFKNLFIEVLSKGFAK
jgi:hypothetical protein